MKNHLLLKAAAAGAAVTIMLSGFTCQASSATKTNPMIEALTSMADGVSKSKTISFGQKRFDGYKEAKVLMSTDSLGTYTGFTSKQTSRSNYERIDLKFTKFDGVDTLFDFTVNKDERRTVTIDASLSGDAKVLLVKDKKTSTTIWEKGDLASASKSLTLKPGRYRVRFAGSEAKGNIAVSVDKPNSLYSHTVQKAEKAYNKIMEPALEQYQETIDKSNERYDHSIKSATEEYSKALSEIDKAYNEAIDKMGDFEYTGYLSREDGEKVDEEYQRKYSKLDEESSRDIDKAEREYDKLIEQADGYLQERKDAADEKLEKAEQQAKKAWDAIVG